MPESTPTWNLDVRDGIALLTFTRPPANWMNRSSMGDLATHLDALATRDDAMVVVLTGGVDGYFIAHADLDELNGAGAGGRDSGDPNVWNRPLSLLESIPQPTIAAIDGQAWGGGLETALACSMRLASERAHFALPEVGIGLIPGAGGTQRIARLLGPGRALELCTTGRRVFADEAVAIGLVNAVLPTEGFIDHVRHWCGRVTRNASGAIYTVKRVVLEGLELPLADGLALERRAFLALNSRDEARARNAAVQRPGT